MADRATRIEASRRLRPAIPMTLPRVFAWCLLMLLSACATLPERASPVPSSAFADTCGTRLGRSVCPAAAAHAGRTGVHALPNGRDAFAARYLLARAAERSIDVQYYIWHADTSGGLLAQRCGRPPSAACACACCWTTTTPRARRDARGARRAPATSRCGCSIPFANRGWRVGDYADRLPARQPPHAQQVVHGRQPGRRSSAAATSATSTSAPTAPWPSPTWTSSPSGAVVREVSAAFDAYWNSASAYPVASLLPRPRTRRDAQVRDAVDEVARRAAGGQAISKPCATTPLVREILAGTLPSNGCPPACSPTIRRRSCTRRSARTLHMLPQLVGSAGQAAARTRSWCRPISCPDARARTRCWRIAARGVKVRVLTNSLAATDVAPVYAGYAKYREELLRGGVRLYELKPAACRPAKSGAATAAAAAAAAPAPACTPRPSPWTASACSSARSTSTRARHGSTPRWAWCSKAPRWRRSWRRPSTTSVPRNAYEVRLAGDGRASSGSSARTAGEVRHSSPPQAGLLRRLWIGFLSILPIEWLL